ncbi:MAG TPA: ThiF family adenylyltransferase [Pirellulales bacterium]|jgi:adenylyltransferase/sulfurtransferase|nr:ThiF family adenylyltransferase [Pirellulales bacterium]
MDPMKTPAADDEPATPAELARYERQIRFAPLGIEGQRRLAASSALLCGCGALGSHVADLLVRAGIGRLKIVDRDFLELSNLQRQTLFDEQDLADELPKAVAAATRLARINSQVTIEPIVADVDYRNIAELAAGVDLILDGTDNFETRYLINDFAVRESIPWIFAGVVGAAGQTMTILPGETACLRCLMPEPPPAGDAQTCETAGILGPAVGVIASIEASEALKILSGNRAAASRSLAVVDLWDNRLRHVDLAGLPDRVDCPACRRGEFAWLSGARADRHAVLCGRGAVQLTPPDRRDWDLAALAPRLAAVGRVSRNRYLLRLAVEGYQLTLFPDGRAIISGTDDVAQARAVYARYIGH